MLYKYKVINQKGETKVGEIEAVSSDHAVTSLQRRGFIVVSVDKAKVKGSLKYKLPFFDKVPLKDIVMMSRQLSTLFEAQVSAVRAFSLLAGNLENKYLSETLQSLTQDIQGGISITDSMRKYPDVFSDFYINMIAAGEESGRLTETFTFLADYMERQYELTSKTKNALVYPAFVIFTFTVVLILMMTVIIPKLGDIIEESGQEVPFFTKLILGISDFLLNYGLIILAVFIGLVVYGLTSLKKESNRMMVDTWKLKIPYFKNLFKMLYLSRIADNMQTMLSAGIPVVRTLEITASVVDNKVFEQILLNAVESVKAGNLISSSLEGNEMMPEILVQMIRVGEETGSLATILKTLGKFYKREVDSAVDTLIGLIEPAMIIGLGIAVGILLTSVLMPIYNIAGGI